MVVAPFLFTINERFVQPRFLSRLQTRDPDEIDEKGNPVIIAGVGRFGAVVSRLLNAQRIKTTALDIDGEQIDLVRRLGFKVFYGDATRLELLRSAGAEKARLLIIAIDNVDKSIQLTETVQRVFPNLTMLVRAKDRDHAYKLINLGVNYIFRETLDSSLDLSIQALRLLGFGAYRAHRAAKTFKAYDEESVRQLAAFANSDEKDFLGEIRRRVRTIDELFEAERAGQAFRYDAGWDPPRAG